MDKGNWLTSYQAADDVDIMHGKHQIAFGVDLLRTRDGQNNHYQDNGVFNFDGRYSNDPLLDFLCVGGLNREAAGASDVARGR